MNPIIFKLRKFISISKYVIDIQDISANHIFTYVCFDRILVDMKSNRKFNFTKTVHSAWHMSPANTEQKSCHGCLIFLRISGKALY